MKKFGFKKLGLFLGIAASLALVLSGCGSSSKSSSSASSTKRTGQSTVQQIKKRGTIRIAVFGDLPPYGWVNKQGQRVGYDLTLARQIAKDLKVKPKFVQVNANNRVDALNSNKVDLVLANFTVTPERKQVVDFASPYMKVSVGVVSPKFSRLRKLVSFKARTSL